MPTAPSDLETLARRDVVAEVEVEVLLPDQAWLA